MADSNLLEVASRNRLLATLPEETRRSLVGRMDRLDLDLRKVLHEPGEAVHYVYFPVSAAISLVATNGDRHALEVGATGREGVIGLPVLLGNVRNTVLTIAQVRGEVLRMPAEEFRGVLKQQPSFRLLLERYAGTMMAQLSQLMYCNHFHPVEERLCRWLLQVADRVDSTEFELTQEFLSWMLGVRRPTVTVVAGMLQTAGLITYRRGDIKLLNIDGLRSGACECYEVMKQQIEDLFTVPLAERRAPRNAGTDGSDSNPARFVPA